MAGRSMVLDLTVKDVRRVVPTDRLYLVSENLERNTRCCRILPLEHVFLKLAVIRMPGKTDTSRGSNPRDLVDEFHLVGVSTERVERVLGRGWIESREESGECWNWMGRL